MSASENKKLIRRLIEEWNKVNGDVAKMRSLFVEYYSPGFIYHDVSADDTNLEETMEEMARYLSAFPDVSYSIDDILAEGDRTAIRCTLHATHKGTFNCIPATGKQIVVRQVEIHRIVRGKIVEAWGFSDSYGMMTQLGAIPDFPGLPRQLYDSLGDSHQSPYFGFSPGLGFRGRVFDGWHGGSASGG